jgi:hypothetical protein
LSVGMSRASRRKARYRASTADLLVMGARWPCLQAVSNPTSFYCMVALNHTGLLGVAAHLRSDLLVSAVPPVWAGVKHSHNCSSCRSRCRCHAIVCTRAPLTSIFPVIARHAHS